MADGAKKRKRNPPKSQTSKQGSRAKDNDKDDGKGRQQTGRTKRGLEGLEEGLEDLEAGALSLPSLFIGEKKGQEDLEAGVPGLPTMLVRVIWSSEPFI